MPFPQLKAVADALDRAARSGSARCRYVGTSGTSVADYQRWKKLISDLGIPKQ
jgi:hypothetical protein